MAKITKAPDNLPDSEWQRLISIFGEDLLAYPFVVLRKVQNKPQTAEILFPRPLESNQGAQERINTILLKNKISYRLTRIGGWRKGERRLDRKLAVVPWSHT